MSKNLMWKTSQIATISLFHALPLECRRLYQFYKILRIIQLNGGMVGYYCAVNLRLNLTNNETAYYSLRH